MNADGSDSHLFAADPWDDMMPSWSKDGHSIYFACKPNGVLQVCKREINGGVTLTLTRQGGG